MKNYQQSGNILDLTAPVGGVVSGNAYLIGGLLAVANADADAGDIFAGTVEGVVELPKESTTAAFTEGERVYWDDGNSQMDEAATGRYFAGTAVEAAGASATTVKVKLLGYATEAEA
jgi:predicted RecA/RadA family phage recombinase